MNTFDKVENDIQQLVNSTYIRSDFMSCKKIHSLPFQFQIFAKNVFLESFVIIMD